MKEFLKIDLIKDRHVASGFFFTCKGGGSFLNAPKSEGERGFPSIFYNLCEMSVSRKVGGWQTAPPPHTHKECALAQFEKL